MPTLKALRFIGSVAAVLALAGCSGGGGGMAPGAIPGTGAIAGTKPIKGSKAKMDDEGLYHLQTEYLALNDHFRNARPIYAADVPTYGRATYNGIAAFKANDGVAIDEADLARNPDLLADMALTVDFTRNKVSGSMWSFHDGDGAVADGSIQLEGQHDKGTVTAKGADTLYSGDYNQYVTVGMSGFIHNRIDGVNGYLGATSRTGLEETSLGGKAILHYDSADHQV